MDIEDYQQLNEQLQTINNLIIISKILSDLKEEKLLPTMIEILYLEVQDLVSSYCVEE